MAEADVAGTHGLACKDLGDELRRGFAHGIGIDNPHDGDCQNFRVRTGFVMRV
jgi:hypothetical protein